MANVSLLDFDLAVSFLGSPSTRESSTPSNESVFYVLPDFVLLFHSVGATIALAAMEVTAIVLLLVASLLCLHVPQHVRVLLLFLSSLLATSTAGRVAKIVIGLVDASSKYAVLFSYLRSVAAGAFKDLFLFGGGVALLWFLFPPKHRPLPWLVYTFISVIGGLVSLATFLFSYQLSHIPTVLYVSLPGIGFAFLVVAAVAVLFIELVRPSNEKGKRWALFRFLLFLLPSAALNMAPAVNALVFAYNYVSLVSTSIRMDDVQMIRQLFVQTRLLFLPSELLEFATLIFCLSAVILLRFKSFSKLKSIAQRPKSWLGPSPRSLSVPQRTPLRKNTPYPMAKSISNPPSGEGERDQFGFPISALQYVVPGTAHGRRPSVSLNIPRNPSQW